MRAVTLAPALTLTQARFALASLARTLALAIALVLALALALTRRTVWIAGSPADDGKRIAKRIATLIITARAVCDDSQPRRGQPKMSITCRGQGKKISAL